MKVEIIETGEIKEIVCNAPGEGESFLIEAECFGCAWGYDLFAPTYAPPELYPDTADVDPNTCMDAMCKYGVRMHKAHYDELREVYDGWAASGYAENYWDNPHEAKN